MDEGTNNVICLPNQDYCPPEYNCYNKERKLCLPNSSSSDCTIELSASITETNEIFDDTNEVMLKFGFKDAAQVRRYINNQHQFKGYHFQYIEK